jgi:hypothetical protein
MAIYELPKPIGKIEVNAPSGVEANSILKAHLMEYYGIAEREANALIFEPNFHIRLHLWGGELEFAQIALRDAICKVSKFSNHPKQIPL